MNRPLVFLSISFVIGIILGKFFSLPLIVLYLLCVLFLFIIAFGLATKKYKITIFLFCLLILLGILRYQFAITLPQNEISRFADERYYSIQGLVTDTPLYKNGRINFTLRAEELNSRGKKLKVQGLVRVNCFDDSKLNYGDKIELEGKLSLPLAATNPGISSFSDYLALKNIRCELRTFRQPKVLKKGQGNRFVAFCVTARDHLMKSHFKIMKPPFDKLLAGILFGSRVSPLDQETKETYRRAGVVHLLVVSGLHVGILIGVCLGICRALNFPLGLSVFLTTLFNLIFIVMTGAGPSVIRAGIMVQMTLLGLLFEREKDVYTSLAFAALVLLLWSPMNLFDIGFQFSFAATWALVYVAPAFEKRLEFLPKAMRVPISISAAPVLVTLPISAYYFSQISLVAFFANMILIPWVGILVILGFSSLILGLIFPFGAEVVSSANWIVLWFFNGIAQFFAHLPFACRFVIPPGILLLGAYYGGLVIMVENFYGRLKMDKQKWLIVGLIIISLFTSQFAVQAVVAPWKGKQLVVTVFDVGQGDGILVESPSGKKMLVDGGDRKAGIVKLLGRKGINKLDLVVLTHPHEDHVGGLPDVLRKFKVIEVLDSGQTHPFALSYINFLHLVKEKDIVYHLARAGQVIDLGGGVKGYILHPAEPFIEESALNNNSVVIRLIYGQVSILLTGDMEKEGEERLLKRGFDLESSILKVGHHGSKTSTNADFLRAVKPKVGVISVGRRNKFRHPSKWTIKKLNLAGIKVYRTDQNGAIIVRTDGKKYIVESIK